MNHLVPRSRSLCCAFSLVLASLFLGTSAFAQMTPDRMAEQMLNSARKAYNEKNTPFAIARFREFLGRFGGHKDAPAARFGLALALLEGPERNYYEARDLLNPVAANKDFPERALAQYYLAVALRGQGIKELLEAEARPQETPQRRQAAAQRFNEALPLFKTALAALTQRADADKTKDAKELSLAREWAARARCDVAEMQLRLLKAKEAQATAAPFVADPVLSRSRYRDLGRYYYGHASLLLDDVPAAQKALSMLAPFDSAYGSHGHYLLARTHHLMGERPEATAHYEAALADYRKNKADAAKLLQQPDKLRNEPEERRRLEGLVRHPLPESLGRALLYLGALQYEGGKFNEARTHFREFLKNFPQSPLKTEAELRLGFAQVQLKDYAEALKTLTPLVERDPKLSDQVLFWIGKAQVGAAPEPSANAAGYQQALQNALNTFRQAVERAQRVAAQDPDAKARRGEIQLEMADVMELLKQPREAVNQLAQIINEKALPDREEELQQRLAIALHLAGDYNESDKVCQRFVEKHPRSALLPAVLLTYAENSYFRLPAAEKLPNPAERQKELTRLYDETAKRFKAVTDKFPEYPRVQVARFSLGLTYYRQGELDKAKETLEAIPAADRSGELALTPYLIADCILRQTPTTVPDDALAAGKLQEQLTGAAETLEAFIAAHPKHAQVPDALLKLGLVEQRMASLLAQPPEKAKVLAVAQQAYERLLREFPKDPLAPQALLERAKTYALAGDPNRAINELRVFATDPLRTSSAAPMGLVAWATYLRGQNRAAEAADVLAKGREAQEPLLAKDPARESWTALLRYHHGLALRDAGKLPEARAAFDAVVKMGPNRPEAAEAALRFGQCLKEEGALKLDAAHKLRQSGRKEDQTLALKNAEDGYRAVREAVGFLEGQAEQLKNQPTRQDVRARMLYEAAWGARTLAEPEIETARTALAKALQQKLGPGAAKLPLPDVPLAQVPPQPSEKKARDIYRTIVASFPESPIATEARFELAELLAQRGENEEAIKLLNAVLDTEPPTEMTEKVRLRLGGIQAAQGNLKGALAHFDAVAANPKSALAGWAAYRAGEALLQAEQLPEAIKRLSVFRDRPPFHNLPNLSDRALLRLGQAYAQEKNWDGSWQALERVAGTWPNGPWADEARYGMAWAMQQKKNYDAAVNLYSQVTARTATPLAAKAQLQIGLCRLEQKRYVDAANALLVVPFTYDYPEISAAAVLEAAGAYTALHQNEQAIRLLQRLQRDYANTPWADAATERLKTLGIN